MTTNDLRAWTTARLSDITREVYCGTAPGSAKKPYLVYGLEVLSRKPGMTIQELEVEVVDYGRDTARAEAMADAVEAALHDRTDLTEHFFVAIYHERRQPIYENDRLIIRRRLTFQVRVHERS